MSNVRIELEGEEEAVAAIKALYDEKEIRELSEAILHRLQVVAMDNTPVVTGAMRGAWIVEDASLFISPGAVNPRTGTRVENYATAVDERRGVMNAVISQWDAAADSEIRRYGY